MSSSDREQANIPSPAASARILGGRSATNISWPAGLGAEPAIGAHLVTPRRGYGHHGIYVGEGHVIHYAGFARSRHVGPVEEVTMDGFANGHSVSIVEHSQARYSAQQVVQRARSRLGECDFHLLTNNCEHFCNWCISGLHRSEQVDRLRLGPRAPARSAAWRAVRYSESVPLQSRWVTEELSSSNDSQPHRTNRCDAASSGCKFVHDAIVDE